MTSEKSIGSCNLCGLKFNNLMELCMPHICKDGKPFSNISVSKGERVTTEKTKEELAKSMHAAGWAGLRDELANHHHCVHFGREGSFKDGFDAATGLVFERLAEALCSKEAERIMLNRAMWPIDWAEWSKINKARILNGELK